MKFSAKHVVIDADIARSAGETEHPVSRNSRNVLQAVLISDLFIALCPTMKQEWRKHSSKYTIQWLAMMAAKKRYVTISPPQVIQAEINRAAISEAQKEVAEKDAHIVNAALLTDKFIASNDKTARDVFRLVAGDAPVMSGLAWAVPSEDTEMIVRLFQEKGYIPMEWLLR